MGPLSALHSTPADSSQLFPSRAWKRGHLAALIPICHYLKGLYTSFKHLDCLNRTLEISILRDS